MSPSISLGVFVNDRIRPILFMMVLAALMMAKILATPETGSMVHAENPGGLDLVLSWR